MNYALDLFELFGDNALLAFLRRCATGGNACDAGTF
jgi:hypothetical protein